MVEGECKTGVHLVNDKDQSKIWDGVVLKSIGVGESGQWETDGVNVFRTTGNVGIGLNNPDNYPFEVAGPININSNLDGAALYSNQRQMLWYNKDFDFAMWGADAGSNILKAPVGIGGLPPEGADFYVIRDKDSNIGQTRAGFFVNKNEGTADTTAGYFYAEANNSEAYGSWVTALQFGSEDTYGTRSYVEMVDNQNDDVAYGVYAFATNPSTTCGDGCPHAYGVYASSGNSDIGTGVYGVSRFIGGHFVGSGGDAYTVGLKVDNEVSEATGAEFLCSGDCTSAIFYSGDDAEANVTRSGMVHIGSPQSDHLALDNNEIMAKTWAGSSDLYINADGGSVALFKGNPTYKLQLANNSNNLTGRGLAYSWDTYSDGRVKQSQRPLDYGIETVMALQPRAYDHYEGNVRDGRVELGDDYQSSLGFVAQEVYNIVPEAVTKPQDELNELWSMDNEKLIPILVNAIQDQQETIQGLKKSLCQVDPSLEICS